MTSSPLNRRERLAFASAIFIFMIVGVVSFRSMVASTESERWVSHTQEVMASLDDLLTAMETVESSERGYVLTGEESYLETFRQNKLREQQDEAQVQSLTADNPTQQARLPELDALAARRIRRSEVVIGIRHAQDMQAAADAIRGGEGPKLMEDFRAIVGNMQDEEERLLALRNVEAKRTQKESRIVLILGSVLGLLIALLAGWNAARNSARRERAECELFSEKERAEVTLNSIGDAVACTDTPGNITYLNRVAQEMTGWKLDEACDRPFGEVIRILDADTRETIPNPAEMAIAQNQALRLPPNCVLVRRDGFEIPIEDSVAPIHDREGHATGAVIVFHDVTEERAMAAQIVHSARHDFLTGLPNRVLLHDRVSQAIASALRGSRKIAVMFLDLDGFKHINDSLGHAVGDQLLQSIAKRLVACVRPSDTVSRQGGDEFVVVLADMAQPDGANQVAKRMLEAVAEPHPIEGHDLLVTTSIGVSLYPDDGVDAGTLIKNADTAMYQAKEHGRQNYQFFKSAMNVRAVERQSLEAGLRRALKQNEFSLHYQPKVSLRTGEITGAEALIRWTHPTQGMMSPAQFIPIAEDSGLIEQIGIWVLREACTQARAWLDAGLRVGTVAVNISALQLREENFLEHLDAVLKETGLDPRFLELELTESGLMKHAGFTEIILQSLRARGVLLAVDDFGTGYSSLSYLRRFPIDVLKIDQSFIQQISSAPDENPIVTAVIGMGRALKLKVVAEGVETGEQLAFLQAHQCDEAQGYFFSRPVPAEQFAALLKTGLPDALRRRRPIRIVR
ncbi:MAG TPA: EAL domain-containing protein [Acidobacteriaceae bacterium]|jgi:diguanylate cyclase (GGDEF)-like protein/PAS domain S-box-containing protein